ncbi:MAG TPA: hypothetical protein VGH54_10430 [Mycobacterium sp.]|uniref:hypothetical protein n=1 Tax=Mycobacterium sp. TaxID=1785 RepID=UPI002F3F4182
MAAKSKVSVEDAAKVLSVYVSEVTSVDETDEGTVATTFDGQRYLIDGDDFLWLKADSTVPQILAD